jgi:hypothetical protein
MQGGVVMEAFVVDVSTLGVAACTLALVLAIQMEIKDLQGKFDLLLKYKRLSYANAF